MSYTLEFNEIATLMLQAYGLEEITGITFLTQTEADANSPWLASSSADLKTTHDDLVRLLLELCPDLHELGCTQTCLDAYKSMLVDAKLVECGRPSEIYSPLTGLTESWVKQHAELYEAMLTFCRSIECPCDLHILHNEIDSWTIIDRSEIHGLTECWVNLVDFALNEGTDIESFDSDEVWESPSNNGEICLNITDHWRGGKIEVSFNLTN